MKILNFAKIIISCFFLNISCSPGNDKPIENFLAVSSKQLNFWHEGGVRFITVNTNNKDFFAVSDSAWCDVEILETTTDNLKVSVSENIIAGRERTTEIVVFTDDLEEKIIVNQLANSTPPDENDDKKEYLDVRAMSYNVRHFRGMDEVVDYQRIANIINALSPDVVALQEVDSVTIRTNGVNQTDRIAGLTGMYGTFSFSILYQDGKYGNAILSKERPLFWRRIPLPGVEPRSLLIAEFKDYVFMSTHFCSANADNRFASVAIVTQAAAEYDKHVILAGDINATPTTLVLTALRQNWQILSDVEQFTIPVDAPARTIDYIFGYTGKEFTYHVQQARVLDEPVASDHLPLFVDVRMTE